VSKLQGNILVSALKSLPLFRIAICCGWMKRRPKKIYLLPLILTIVENMLGREISYQSIAVSLGLSRGKSVSRQAVFKRVNAHLVTCIQKCIGCLIAQEAGNSPPMTKLFKSFARVLLQDSSSFHASDELVLWYKGNYSRGKTKAVGKIDVIWNIKNGTILEWVLKPFTHSDHKASSNVLAYAKKGDLIIRDLGYLVSEVLKQLKVKGADFLSRYKQRVNVYDSITGEKLNLLRVLQKTRNLDQIILLGEEKIPVRMIAIQLSAEKAGERRRKARKDRNKRLNHSSEYMKLLGWSIFITSVDRSVWSPEDVARAYGLRWSIEMLFKSWKSCLNATPPVHHAVSRPFFFETYIHLILLFVIVVQLPVYMNLLLRNSPWKQYTELSLIKLTTFLAIAFRSGSTHQCSYENLLDLADYYASYEKRKRKNHAQDLWNPKN
jgi:hypothetical protein